MDMFGVKTWLSKLDTCVSLVTRIITLMLVPSNLIGGLRDTVFLLSHSLMLFSYMLIRTPAVYIFFILMK